MVDPILDNHKITPDEEEYLNALKVDTKTYSRVCPDCQEVHGICVKHTLEKRLHELLDEAGVSPSYWEKTINADWNLKQDFNSRDLSPSDLDRKKYAGVLMSKYVKALPLLCQGKKIKIQSSKTKKTSEFNSVVLIGSANSGKTLLASIVVRAAIQKGLTAKLYEWTELCTILQSYDARTRQDEIAEEMKTLDVVAIDGVTDYNITSQCFIMQLDRISKLRFSTGKPTIISGDAEIKTIKNAKQGWHGLISSCKELYLPSPSN